MNTKIQSLCLMAITLFSLPGSAQSLSDIPWDDPGLSGAEVLVYQPMAPPTYADPAITRRSILPSAETLPSGAIEFTCRGLLTTELAFGVTDWLEINIKNIPVFMLFLDDGVINTFWSGGLRTRFVKSKHVTLTAHADGFSVMGWAGIHAGLSLRLGTDRISFHGSASGIQAWEVSDSQPDYMTAQYCPSGDCATTYGAEETPTMQAFLVSGGVDFRVHRKVKLQADVSYYRDSTTDMLAIAPSVRLHGKHFATDLGLLLMRTGYMDSMVPIPLVNFSVTY